MEMNVCKVNIVPETSKVEVIPSFKKTTQRVKITSRNWTGPRTLTVARDRDGYGFTLRYFVVYPPPSVYKGDDDAQENYWSDFELERDEVSEKRSEPLETFFVKNVAAGGAADSAGLSEGDRIVSINGNLIGGKSYKDVVDLIQCCSGDLKIGVVPKDEDILQLAYQDYVYDRASLGYTEGLEQLAQDFDMHQPSVNKWSTPIVGYSRKSSEESINEIVKPTPTKYDPCVSFAAGTPVLKPDVRFSVTVKQGNSSSNSSSGNSTPGARISAASSPPIKVKKTLEPCVSFVSGKPVIAPEDNRLNRNEYVSSAINAVSLNNALRQKFPDETRADCHTARKGRVIVKQHFDCDAIQIAGRPDNDDCRTTYITGNASKKSAISVLREDFREPVSTDLSPDNEDNSPSSPEPTFQLNFAVAEPNSSIPKPSPAYSRDLISKGQRARAGGNLSSQTSQATLVQSRNGAQVPFDRNQTARKGIRSHPNNDSQSKRRIQTDTKGNKIGFVAATRDNRSYYRSHKISSSSDLSDDDSAVECSREMEGVSADEGDSFSRKGGGGRRVSYLMATATSPTVKIPHKLTEVHNTEADDEDSDALNNSHGLQRHYSQESVETEEDEIRSMPPIQEGWLNKKLVHSSDGRKRASSRTWKSLYAVLRGHFLYCYKDKIEVDGFQNEDEQIQVINLKGSVVDIAHDYAKRKHVLRLTTHTGSEFLFQASDTQSLMAWVNNLRESNPEKDTNGNAYENVIVRRMKSYEGETNTTSGTSPPGQTKSNNSKRGLSLKKTHFTLGYKNTKKRGLVNIHISHPKDKEIQATGFTFGIPLEQCPPGKEDKFVPILLEHCCQVVEEKGLDYLGIYRVPGNAAAVQALQEELDTKDPDTINFEEEKWHDLNNIGSLLKSFLRKLPEPLIPKEMYTKFIQANREEDSNERLKSLRFLVRSLPDYHNQTLRFLTMHLRQIADHSEKNKMEPKNLAIVFGPTVVRTSDENMVSMVKDMSDQCRIIETLIHQADWIYTDDDSIELCSTEEPVKDLKAQPPSLGLSYLTNSATEAIHFIDLPKPYQSHKSLHNSPNIETNLSRFFTNCLGPAEGFSTPVRTSQSHHWEELRCELEKKLDLQENDGKCYVASKGLLESLGQMAENYEGEQPAKGKDKQGVASAIMSLTNFTSGISLKIRNKAMSPVFSKKIGKNDPNAVSDQDPFTSNNNDDGSNMPPLRRLGSDPQILSHDIEPVSKPQYRSEGENEEEFTRVKSRIKSKYSRAAVPLGAAQVSNVNRPQDKQSTTEPARKNACKEEPPKPTPHRGANITFQIPLRAEVTVRDDAKKDADAYKTRMLSEKTKLRLQQVTVQHQAAVDQRQIDREKIEREHEKTLRDLRQDEEDSIGDETFSSATLRDSDEISLSSDSSPSSRKESLDSLHSPMSSRGYPTTSRNVSTGSSVSSDEKLPVYALTREEIEQREREKKQLDLFLGQFESIDEEQKQSPRQKMAPVSIPSRGVTSIENLGAKSLDEKLRILLDPTFQEKDGKLVRRTHSPIDSSFSNKLDYHSQNKRANFAASIRGLDKPLKTKVIGLSAAKISTPMYSADMAARIDTFKQKKQELEKKVSSILQDSSKTKDIYENDLNKTDEQKVASLRQKTQQTRPFHLPTPTPTQRVLVSAGDLSQNPSRVAPVIFENPARENIDSSLKRLDRNVQQVVELLQDSHMDELTGENSELAALLNNLQRQAASDPCVSNTNWAKRHGAGNIENDDRNAAFQPKSKRGDVMIDSIKTGANSRPDAGKADLVRVQEWRTGPPLSGQSNFKYSKMYPR